MSERKVLTTRIERAEALTASLDILMHDLTNHLNVCNSATQYALQVLESPHDNLTKEDALEVINDIHAGHTAMSEVLQFVSNYSRGMPLEKAAMSVKDVTRYIRNTFDLKGDTGVMFQSHKVGLGLIIDNLVSNATEASPAGSGVTISVKNSGEGVTIAVEDSGKGLSPMQVENYGMLESSKTDDGAHGIGNRIVMDLAAALDIDVHVHSVLGQGTRISLNLVCT